MKRSSVEFIGSEANLLIRRCIQHLTLEAMH